MIIKYKQRNNKINTISVKAFGVKQTLALLESLNLQVVSVTGGLS